MSNIEDETLQKKMEEVRWQFFDNIQSEELCDDDNEDFGLVPDQLIKRNVEVFIEKLGEVGNETIPEVSSDSVLERAFDIFTYINFNPCIHNVSKWIRQQFLILFQLSYANTLHNTY